MQQVCEKRSILTDIIIIIIMQRLTRHVSVIRMTNRRSNYGLCDGRTGTL